MAPKRASHLDDPPAVSSSSDDEEEASSEEASGSEDDEQGPSNSNVKPKEETPSKTKKPRSKPSATPSRQSAKRTKNNDSNAENGGGSEEEAKKSRGDDSKKLLFQRLWSEDDEIAILKGMIDYGAKTGLHPAVADMNAFHDFIKKSLHIDATKTQLGDKVRRLKKKYWNNLKKRYTPTKPHELEAFELSKKIWGSRGDPKSNGTEQSNQKGKSEVLSSPVAPAEFDTAEIDRNACVSASLSGIIGFDKSLPEHMVKRGFDLISESKKAELEAKWKKLHIAELELFVKKSQLISEQTKLILEAIKSSEQ